MAITACFPHELEQPMSLAMSVLLTCAMVDGTRNGKRLHSELENHHAING